MDPDRCSSLSSGAAAGAVAPQPNIGSTHLRVGCHVSNAVIQALEQGQEVGRVDRPRARVELRRVGGGVGQGRVGVELHAA